MVCEMIFGGQLDIGFEPDMIFRSGWEIRASKRDQGLVASTSGLENLYYKPLQASISWLHGLISTGNSMSKRFFFFQGF